MQGLPALQGLQASVEGNAVGRDRYIVWVNSHAEAFFNSVNQLPEAYMLGGALAHAVDTDSNLVFTLDRLLVDLLLLAIKKGRTHLPAHSPGDWDGERLRSTLAELNLALDDALSLKFEHLLKQHLDGITNLCFEQLLAMSTNWLVVFRVEEGARHESLDPDPSVPDDGVSEIDEHDFPCGTLARCTFTRVPDLIALWQHALEECLNGDGDAFDIPLPD
jgi:hypothetical protein